MGMDIGVQFYPVADVDRLRADVNARFSLSLTTEEILGILETEEACLASRWACEMFNGKEYYILYGVDMMELDSEEIPNVDAEIVDYITGAEIKSEGFMLPLYRSRA